MKKNLLISEVNGKNNTFPMSGLLSNYNNAETTPPNTSFPPAMRFSAWIHFTGWILLFALEQHPPETHLQLPLLLVEHSSFPKITLQGIQIVSQNI